MARSITYLALALSLWAPVPAFAATGEPPPGIALQPVASIRPIFSQLLMFSYPGGFNAVLEETRPGYYLQESVPAGESVEKWSEMITVTGAKGITANPEASPRKFASAIAEGFQRACPATFSATGLGGATVDGHEAYAALLGCGTVTRGAEARSESAVVIVIAGDNDYYTLQWAERGRPSKDPLTFDIALWTERMKKLLPVKLCPILPGEAPPYDSCLNRK